MYLTIPKSNYLTGYKWPSSPWPVALHPAWSDVNVLVFRSPHGPQDAFDDDDTLTYDPETTGAIILGG